MLHTSDLGTHPQHAIQHTYVLLLISDVNANSHTFLTVTHYTSKQLTSNTRAKPRKKVCDSLFKIILSPSDDAIEKCLQLDTLGTQRLID